jgi:hypothetical protein
MPIDRAALMPMQLFGRSAEVYAYVDPALLGQAYGNTLVAAPGNARAFRHF